MSYARLKIILIAFALSLYNVESNGDNSILSQLNTDLNSLASYAEIFKKSQPADEFSEISWDEWYEKCNNLPFGRELGFDTKGYLRAFPLKPYNNQAILWYQFDKTLQEFIKVNKEILNQKSNWIANPPLDTDEFLAAEKPLNPINPFVQKLVVTPNTTIAFHGDFHSDAHSMVKYIERLNTDGYLDGFKIKVPNFYLVFLGDYVDRGYYGAEVWYTLMRLKIANPNHVIIIRGNHEDQETATNYGFAEEFVTKFDSDLLKEYKTNYIAPEKLKKFFRIFDFLPTALYLGSGSSNELNYLLCVHGGIEKKFDSNKLLSSPSKLAFDWLKFDDNFPKNYINIGFMWNDFEYDPKSKNVIKYGRGSSFSKRGTAKFFANKSNEEVGYKIKGIFRAHQHSTGEDDKLELIRKLPTS